MYAKSFGGNYYDWINSVAVFAPDNFYAAGRYASADMSFDTLLITNYGTGNSDDGFVAKGGPLFTSVNENMNLNYLNVLAYPNPGVSFPELQFSEYMGWISLSVIDALGNTILTLSENNTDQIKFPENKITAGMYYINISGPGINRMVKFVVK
jgi:hypothetical protein